MKRFFTIVALFAACPVAHGDGILSSISGENGAAGHHDGTGGGARFNDPMGLARDSQGNLFVCDARNHVIRKISPAGIVSTVAGEPGEFGAANGIGSAARFYFPADIAIAPDGTLYIADSGNHCIRKIIADGTVSTLAGKLGGAVDYTPRTENEVFTVSTPQLDGQGETARFNTPSGIAYSPAGFLYVGDTENQTIRKVTLNGTVTTVAGATGVWGKVNGTGSSARFQSPMGMCIGVDGNLYIADSLNHCIRRMTPAGVVTTFAGSTLQAGSKVGTALEARFSQPTDITCHPDGGFIICDSFKNTLYRITSDGTVSKISDTSSLSALANPSAAVCDPLGNVFVSDTFNQQVQLIIEKFGMETTLVNGTHQLRITWDSLPGRDYQLQILADQGWINAPLPIVRASAAQASISLPMPAQKTGIYRILLIGF